MIFAVIDPSMFTLLINCCFFIFILNINWLLLGMKKPYYVRDYLSPKHIKEHGLAEILEAMEFADRNNDNRKKQLLSYLWPDTSRNFSAIFQPFKREKPGEQNDDENQGDTSVGLVAVYLGPVFPQQINLPLI